MLFRYLFSNDASGKSASVFVVGGPINTILIIVIEAKCGT